MDLLQLTYFSAVANSASMNRAAEKLNVSQSTLSVSIKRLEEELGVALFQKNGRKNQLTEAGRVFLRGAEEILSSVQQLRRQMTQFEQKDSCVLNLITDYSQLGIRSTALFSKLFPEVTVRLSRIDQRDGKGYLLREQAELWLSHAENSDPLLHTECLLSDIVMVFMPSGHPLAKRQSVTLKELRGETIVCAKKTATRERYEALFTKAGISADSFFEVEEAETTLHFVAAGYGIGFSSRCIHNDSVKRNMELPNISYIPVEDSDFKAGAYLSRLSDKPLSEPARLYWEFMQRYGLFAQQNGVFPQEDDCLGKTQ